VANGIVVGVEVLFGHHSEGADGRQRAAVLPIQLVYAVAIDKGPPSSPCGRSRL
jgi:hypothetical protein